MKATPCDQAKDDRLADPSALSLFSHEKAEWAPNIAIQFRVHQQNIGILKADISQVIKYIPAKVTKAENTIRLHRIPVILRWHEMNNLTVLNDSTHCILLSPGIKRCCPDECSSAIQAAKNLLHRTVSVHDMLKHIKTHNEIK
ncbi:hypothetical protein KR49_09695 [Synechococcus sp. KORDI-49]|nr:hypothetical protein KR49_09695 [Synechococcus sp. KORDI-49]